MRKNIKERGIQAIGVEETIIGVEVDSMEGDLLKKFRRNLVVQMLKVSLQIERHLGVEDLMVEEGLVEEGLVCSLVSALLVTK